MRFWREKAATDGEVSRGEGRGFWKGLGGKNCGQQEAFRKEKVVADETFFRRKEYN